MAMRRRSILLFVSALLLSAGALAQELTFGKWSTGRSSSGSGFYAATVNDSGHVLGRYCHGGNSCVYLLGIATACTKGTRYPVLVNATTGANTLEVYCNGPMEGGNKYQYVFTAFDDVEQLVLRADRVSFAIPIAGVAFTIVPFSLIGSNEAIAAMTAASIASTTPAPARGRNTRDERL
jgi:hypothetical protein